MSPFCFQDFWWSLLSLFWMLFQVSCLILPRLLRLVGFYHVPSTTYFSAFSFCLVYCLGVSFLQTERPSVQFSRSVMSDSATSWTAAHQASLSISNSRSLLKLMSTELVMPSNHLLLCRPLLLLPSIFPSIRVYSNQLALLIRWPKYWSFSLSISPSNEYLELISFRNIFLWEGLKNANKFCLTLCWVTFS